MLYVFVHLHELVVRGHIEARAFIEQGLDDLLIRICFYRVIALDPRQVLLKTR